jgi:HAD superfamily hydrolase (TIGR01509 family)
MNNLKTHDHRSKTIKAVLFDMDGVIVDSEPLHHKAYYMMFDEVGIIVSPELYASFTGQATLEICKTLCAHFKLSQRPEELVAIKRQHFKTLFDQDPDFDLIPGVLSLIQEYHKNGLTLVLASSASMENINRIFKRFDLDQYFIAKRSGADLAASKPHPEIFEKAAQASGFSPGQCVVIEDSENGITAAKAAGIFAIAFDSPNSKAQDYTKADLVINSFEEIKYERLIQLKR